MFHVLAWIFLMWTWGIHVKILFAFFLLIYLLLQRSQLRTQGFPDGSAVENPPANAGDAGLIPGSGRSPGEGNGNPLQYSCLENPMGRGVWRATVPGVSRSQTRHSNSSNRLHLPHPPPQCTDCFFPSVLLWDLSGHFLLMERQSNNNKRKKINFSLN